MSEASRDNALVDHRHCRGDRVAGRHVTVDKLPRSLLGESVVALACEAGSDPSRSAR